MFGIDGNPKDKTINAQIWELAEDLVQQSAKASGPNACSHFNQSLMELGALICTPRAPQCAICPLQNLCVALRSNRIGQLPAIEKRQAATARKFAAFIISKNDRWLVQQRPEGVVNAQLWEFPNVEIPVTAKRLPKDVPFSTTAKPVFTIRHTITRYRIQMDVYTATSTTDAAGKWVSRAELEKLAFSSAHRQIADRISRTSA